MERDQEVIWSGKPWIGPSVAGRTIGVIVLALIFYVILSVLGLLTLSVFARPLYVWALGALALVWLVSVVGLVLLRASRTYTLRRSSFQIEEGIAGKMLLVVSPSAFSELEVDQGVMGRMLDYGSLEVRSQGGQQLNLRLIRDPRGVSARIREVMTVPTVRVARDEAPSGPRQS